MATLVRPLRRTILSSTTALLPQIEQPISIPIKFDFNLSSHTPFRTYLSEMRKSAVHDHILRLIRHEINYELDRSPPKLPVADFNSFKIDDRPGELWINLKRKFSNNEEIKLEATLFDGSIPSSKASDVTKGNGILHFTLIVNISKGDGEILEILCSAWPDSMEITKLFVRSSDNMPAKAYNGPNFNELDDELQDSLYEFLEARGVDDEMAAFLHQYMKNKERNEYLRWMGTVKSYIEE